MKKEIIITAVVVIALIAGITYFRSTRDSTLGAGQQTPESPDWRRAVGRDQARTPARQHRGDGTGMIPTPPSYTHDESGGPEGRGTTSGTMLQAPNVRKPDAQDDSSSESSAPYWEENVEAADDNPESYQPPDQGDDTQEGEEGGDNPQDGGENTE